MSLRPDQFLIKKGTLSINSLHLLGMYFQQFLNLSFMILFDFEHQLANRTIFLLYFSQCLILFGKFLLQYLQVLLQSCILAQQLLYFFLANLSLLLIYLFLPIIRKEGTCSPPFHLLLHQQLDILLYYLSTLGLGLKEWVVGAEFDESFEQEVGQSIEQPTLVLLDVMVAQQFDRPYLLRQAAGLPQALTTFLTPSLAIVDGEYHRESSSQSSSDEVMGQTGWELILQVLSRIFQRFAQSLLWYSLTPSARCSMAQSLEEILLRPLLPLLESESESRALGCFRGLVSF